MVGLLTVERGETLPTAARALLFGQSSPDLDPHVEQMPARGALSCWEALDGRARGLLDQEGRLVDCGQLLSRLIAADRNFQVVSGKLQPIDIRYQARFRRLHQSPLSGVATEQIPMRHAEGHWICRSLHFEAAPSECHYALTIQEALAGQASEWIDFKDIFDLTNTESKVLEECLRGLTPQAIANSHRLSINTVRTHFRHIYDKLAVNNMQDLQWKLSGYRLR